MAKQHKRIAMVIQRFGHGVIGGAEALTAMYAAQLLQKLGWDIEIFTSTAKDYQKWGNDIPAGVSNENGLIIRRYSVVLGRSKFFAFFHRICCYFSPRLARMPLFRPMGRAMEGIWLNLQGPVCPGLKQDLVKMQDDYDAIFLMTYLYYPTLGTYKKLRKFALMPFAHNEPPFFFQITRDLLKQSPVILCSSPAERQLIIDANPEIASKCRGPLGVGIDDLPLPAENLARSMDKITLLYLGRISAGKQVDQLIEHFIRFQDTDPNKPKINFLLLLAGKVEEHIKLPARDDVQSLGFVSEKEKIRLLQAAHCLINPSAHESLSMISYEALAMGTPVLLNRQCQVLKELAQEYPAAAFTYDGYDDFSGQLCKIVGNLLHDKKFTQGLKQTAEIVRQNASWTRIVEQFESVVAELQEQEFSRIDS